MPTTARPSVGDPYLYKLTPKGIEEKARVTYRFLKQKQREYEQLKQEIEELREGYEGGKVRKQEKSSYQRQSVQSAVKPLLFCLCLLDS